MHVVKKGDALHHHGSQTILLFSYSPIQEPMEMQSFSLRKSSDSKHFSDILYLAAFLYNTIFLL